MLKKLLGLKYFIAVFIVFELMSLVLLDYYFSNVRGKHLTESAGRLQTEYRAVFNSYSLLARTLFSDAISRPDILKIFRDAYPADETKRKLLRDRLLQKADPLFQKIRQNEFKLLQFHLPDGTSFLRMHKPEDFGDNLFSLRYSIKLVNTQKKYIEGFEQGRHRSGFRFIFPLAYNNLHIGSVETALSFNGLRKEMKKLFPSDYFLMIKQDSVLKKLFENEHRHYMKSDISDEYLYEIAEMGTDTDKGTSLQKEIFRSVAGRIKNKISEDLKKEKIFAAYTKVGAVHYVVSFLPVKNFEGKTEAYIISLEKDTTISEYEKNHYTILILITLLLLALLTFVYIRKRTEDSLRDLNERLQALINESPLSIVIIDPDGNLLLWNPAAEQMFGWTKEEALGQPLPIVPDSKREEYLDFRQRSCNGESIRSLETVRRRKDGSLVPVALSTAPLHDNKGNITGIMGIIEDISGRKQAEKEMLTAKQMLEDITNGITESILLLSKDYRVVWANKASLQQTGLSIKELIGNYCYKATHAREFPCEPPGDPCPVCKLVETGNPAIEEHLHYDKNGKRLFVEVSAYPIKDDSGEVVQFVHIAKDITDRRVLEERIKENTEQISRQNTELQLINSDLITLYRVSSAISKTIDSEKLFSEILQVVTELEAFRLERKGIIFLVEDDRMRIVSSIGMSEEASLEIHKDMMTGDCLCGLAAATGEIVTSRNSAKDGRHTIIDGTAPVHGHIIVPLKAANKVVGVLCLYLPPDVEVEERTINLMLSMGNQIGVVIENAKLYEKTKSMSLHDPLTGLANRRFLKIQIERTFAETRRYGKQLSVIMLDMDHFKEYNDTHGHAEGDKLLVRVARILLNNMREADHVFRYGGEEFLIILPETDLSLASEVAERTRKAVEAETGVTISLGVSCYEESMPNSETLITRSDNALYQAKNKGRNRVENGQA